MHVCCTSVSLYVCVCMSVYMYVYESEIIAVNCIGCSFCPIISVVL